MKQDAPTSVVWMAEYPCAAALPGMGLLLFMSFGIKPIINMLSLATSYDAFPAKRIMASRSHLPGFEAVQMNAT